MNFNEQFTRRQLLGRVIRAGTALAVAPVTVTLTGCGDYRPTNNPANSSLRIDDPQLIDSVSVNDENSIVQRFTELPDEKLDFKDIKTFLEELINTHYSEFRDDDANLLKEVKNHLFRDEAITTEAEFRRNSVRRTKGIVIDSEDGEISLVLSVNVERNKDKYLSQWEKENRIYPFNFVEVVMVDRIKNEYVDIGFVDIKDTEMMGKPDARYLFNYRIKAINAEAIKRVDKEGFHGYAGRTEGMPNQQDYQLMIETLRKGHLNADLTKKTFNRS